MSDAPIIAESLFQWADSSLRAGAYAEAARLLEQVAARVLPRPLGDTVRDGQDPGPHTGPFVFSSSRTPSTTIALSIAFAMS